jgi:alginate O-acetyltransferase complex protein AlgI
MTFTDFWFYPKTVILIFLLLILQFLFRNKTQIASCISKIILLAYSFYTLFYYDYRYALVLLMVILLTYGFALLVDMSEGKRRSVVTTIGVVLLVCVLGVFKYFNFFATTICSVIGTSWTDKNIILPLGISFYIFSAISYLLDVDWKVMEADKNIINVALFLAFFPKLVCGPIVKGRDFLPQLQAYRKIEWKNFCEGIQIFVFGFFKKVVLADHIAVFVDQVYYAPMAYSTGTVWLAVFSYFLQLYFDFSGYSDMAIGLFRILGYEVERNFNLPFISTTISEFWNRWHISLGSWLTEYLFNPIAVRIKRKIATKPKQVRKKYKNLPSYIAVLITFFVSGIWHGAGWTFIIFGLLHGIISVVQQIYANLMRKKHVKWAVDKKKWLHVVDILLCYICVNLIQVFFRADSLQQACQVFKLMFTYHEGIVQPYTWSFLAYIILIIATVVAYKKSMASEENNVCGYYPIQDLSTVKGLTIFFVVCGLSIVLGYFGETYFIYGAF